MKKLFTLIAVAMMAMTASAKESLALPSPWGESCVFDGSTYTFNGSWAGAGIWLGVDDGWTDASAYDYAVIIYENHTGGDVSFNVEYNKVDHEESWGVAYFGGSTIIDQPKGYAAIALDKTNLTDNGKICAEELRQISLQDRGSQASLTVSDICFMTEAEYKALQEGEPMGPKVKEFALPGEAGVIVMQEGEDASGWYASSWIGLTNLASQGYKTFVIEVESSIAPFNVCAQNWESGDVISKTCETVTSPVVIAYSIGEGAELQGLGQFALQNMNITDTYPGMDGKDVSWYDANQVKVTRAYLTSEVVESTDAIANVMVDAAKSNAMYNLAGQRVSNAKGIVIKNGVKYVVK